MRTTKIVLVVTLVFVTLFSSAQEQYKDATLIKNDSVYNGGKAYEVERFEQVDVDIIPRKVIFLIGDGMGFTQVFSGLAGNGGDLYLKNFRYVGLATTHSADNFITDSAAGGTALSCGKKTYNGAVGVDVDGRPIKNICETLREKGLATGVVSTSAVTHATPASYVAHQAKRSMYEAIAADFLSSDMDVFIGGGLNHFVKRNDGADLTLALKEKGYQVLTSMDEIKKVKSGKLAGLTNKMHNITKLEGRGDMLPDATNTALEILDKDPDGFFVMIEGSQIDWAGHQNSMPYMVAEMLDFDRTVGEALKFAAHDKETLVIVTADHETGGLAVSKGDLETGMVKGLFSVKSHTGVFVPVFAYGPGASLFTGIIDNTDIPKLILKAMKVTE